MSFIGFLWPSFHCAEGLTGANAIKHHEWSAAGYVAGYDNCCNCDTHRLVVPNASIGSHDGLPPRIHVDIDEVLAEIVEDDCSFDDAGDVVPRVSVRPTC